jgi:hypothetical protein
LHAGNQFRGRFRPVYAKELADVIDAQARRQLEALEAKTPVRPGSPEPKDVIASVCL